MTINVSGDLLWHNTLFEAAKRDATNGSEMDFAPMLSSLKPFVERASIAVCHSEVPFAPEGGPYTGYPAFAAPPVAADGIKATGWDICTTASNHTLDQGFDGLVRTVDQHQQAGLTTVGSYRTAEEAAAPVIVTSPEGVKVAFISQTYGFNGAPPPEGKEWAVSTLNADSAIAKAREARAAGADIVAVHMHAGEEYTSAPTSQQREFATAVTGTGEVDFVFGQHAHVVQPIGRVNDRWVVYGTGNLIAESGPGKPYSYDGLMAEAEFTEQADGTFKATAMTWAPILITGRKTQPANRALLIPSELAAGHPLSDKLTESAARTRQIVNSLSVEGLTELQ